MTPEWRAVNRWARKAREASVARNEAIIRAHVAGLSLREIAAAAELSHTAIAKIVKRDV